VAPPWRARAVVLLGVDAGPSDSRLAAALRARLDEGAAQLGSAVVDVEPQLDATCANAGCAARMAPDDGLAVLGRLASDEAGAVLRLELVDASGHVLEQEEARVPLLGGVLEQAGAPLLGMRDCRRGLGIVGLSSSGLSEPEQLRVEKQVEALAQASDCSVVLGPTAAGRVLDAQTQQELKGCDRIKCAVILGGALDLGRILLFSQGRSGLSIALLDSMAPGASAVLAKVTVPSLRARNLGPVLAAYDRLLGKVSPAVVEIPQLRRPGPQPEVTAAAPEAAPSPPVLGPVVTGVGLLAVGTGAATLLMVPIGSAVALVGAALWILESR
jgi:hypothetical protein